MLKISENNGTEEIGLVTPPQMSSNRAFMEVTGKWKKPDVYVCCHVIYKNIQN